jgi:Galactose oxidase, central domain
VATMTPRGELSGLRRCLGAVALVVGLGATGAIALPASVAGASAASSAWTQLTPASSPSPRFGAAVAYDQGTGQTLLFGGLVNNPFFPTGNVNDTWAWNGSSWTWQFPAVSPPGRIFASMAYDPATGQLLLFGGFNGNDPDPEFNDTWTWNGSTWTQLNPTTSPSARYGASMAYDPSTGQMVLFGGIDNVGDSGDDTWTWNGTTWTQLNPATSPAGRYYASMAYDADSSQLVLFGGTTRSGPFSDTWTWNGSTWTQSAPAVSPPARSEASMVYDPRIGQLVLFGGQLGSSYGNDTWTWNGSTWSQQTSATTPPARKDASMVFDGGTSQLVLFGGDNASTSFFRDTWIWKGLPPTTTVARPSNGAIVTGTMVILDASATNATSVEFRLFGGVYGYSAPVLCTATLTLYGWVCSWDSTTSPNGRYVLLAEASNSISTAFSPNVNITIQN